MIDRPEPGAPSPGEHTDRAHERCIGVFTTDLDLVIRSWDATLERMTRMPFADVRGRRLDEVVPDLPARGLMDFIREPLISGAAQVLAPAIHKFLIPCAPLEPSAVFDRMQQRVVVGALRDDRGAAGLIVTIEDVTARVERERELAYRLRDADPATRLAAVEHLSRLGPSEGLDPLTSALGDDHWQVRRSVVRALAARTDAALVETIVAALRDRHRDFSLLSSALQLLELTGADVGNALTTLLSEPDSDLRVQVALALGTQRSPEAVAALITALDDDNQNVRFQAIESLGKLKAPAAIDRLIAIAESRDFFLAFPAIDALVRIGEPTIAPRLVPLLVDPLLGGPAAEALGGIGDEDTVSSLCDALRAPDAPVVSIVNALEAIHRRYSEVFGDASDIEDLVRHTVDGPAADRILAELPGASGDDLRRLVIVVGWLKNAAVPRALALLLGRSGVHHNVIEALVRFGAPAVDLLVEQLAGADLETRRSAIVALGRIGDSRAVLPLTALLQEDDRRLWVHVAGALARIGDARAFEPLLTHVGDEDGAVRQAVIGALNSLGHPAMSSRMRRLLGDASPRVRESAVRIAGYFGYPACVEQLIACCADPEEAVRVAALEHLPFLGDPRALELLRRALDSETPRARAAVARSLGDLPGDEARPMLDRAMADSDAWVRYFSVISAGRHRDASALARLKALALADPARQVRIAAVEAIGLVAGDEGAEVLASIAAGDDEDLANAAVQALGRLKSTAPRAVLRRALRAEQPQRRVVAATAVANSGDPEAPDLLAWTASSDSDGAVVSAALAGLTALAGNQGAVGQRAVQALVNVLGHATRREQILTALSKVPPSAIPWVAEYIESEHAELRRGAVEALGRMTHVAASAYLQRALDDEDAVVRRTAVAGLSRVGARGAGQRIAALAQSDPSEAVRQAAQHALARGRRSDGPSSTERNVRP